MKIESDEEESTPAENKSQSSETRDPVQLLLNKEMMMSIGVLTVEHTAKIVGTLCPSKAKLHALARRRWASSSYTMK